MAIANNSNGTAANAARNRVGSRHQPEQTRASILQAALKEFATEGVAGARTDAIARGAGVNKALLYYYFKDKDSLYAAVLEDFFSGLMKRLHEVLDADVGFREKILDYVAAHFDYVASSPLYSRISLAEMTRPGHDVNPALKDMVERYLRPFFHKIAGVLHDGIVAGEFRNVDPIHFVPSMIGLVVFYFITPVPRLLGINPYEPEHLARRRAAILDFISAALFTDVKRNASQRLTSFTVGAAPVPDPLNLGAAPFPEREGASAKTRRTAVTKKKKTTSLGSKAKGVRR